MFIKICLCRFVYCLTLKEDEMKVKIVIKSVDELDRKANGGIFVQTQEEVELVRAIIESIDEDEARHYLPDDFIKVFNKERNVLGYTGKFDLDIKEFQKRCREQDIYAIVYSCNHYNYDDGLTLEEAVRNQMWSGGYLDDFTYNKTKDW